MFPIPLRGESVGSAYVRLYADGSGVPEDIRRTLKDAEPAVAKSGREAGEVYSEELEAAHRRHFKTTKGEMFEDLNDGLTKQLEKLRVSDAFFKDGQWNEFAARLQRESGLAGEMAAKELKERYRDSGTLDMLSREMEDYGALVRRQQVILVAAREREDAEALKAAEIRAREQSRIMAKAHSEALEMDRDFNTRLLAQSKDTHLVRTTIRMNNFAETVGRLVGRGSRNNFLNFFGSVITNVLNLGGLVLKLGGVVLSTFGKMTNVVGLFFTTFKTNLTEGNKLAASLGVSLTTAIGGTTAATLATAGLNIAVGLVAIVAAIGLVILSAGTLISILVLLTGVLVALAATISFAIMGAIGALVAILPPLVALLGGTVLAIVKLKDMGGPVGKAFSDIKNSAKELSKAFTDRAFKGIAPLFQEINTVLEDSKPLMGAMGDGFRRAFAEIVKGVTGSEFRTFRDAMTRFLPGAMDRLGSITSNTFLGMAGLFRGLIPIARDFLVWLDDITQRFSDWANSAGGQEDIKNFMEDAKESAKSLGGFLKEAIGLIGDFLDAGKGTGDSIFDSMKNALRDVRDYLERNPDALKNFFNDARQFATSLGNAIVDIKDAIDKLDNPGSRAAAMGLIDLIGQIALAVADLSILFAKVARGIVGSWRLVTTMIASTMRFTLMVTLGAMGKIIDAFAGLAQYMGPGTAALAKRIQTSFDKSASGTLKSFDSATAGIIEKFKSVDGGLKALEDAAAKFNPSLDVNTTPAMTKLSALEQRIRNINNMRVGPGGQGGSNAPLTASGGVFHGAQTRIIGEAGSEAVVPLNRPLHLVDPAVRELSAIAQGLRSTGSGAGRPSVDASGWTIVTPTEDPAAVAQEALNRIVAQLV